MTTEKVSPIPKGFHTVTPFYGDRSAGIKDAWDNKWWIATHVENVSDEEMKKREKEFRKEKALK